MAIRADEVDLERDRDLVQRYQAGDLSAFDELYRRYFHRLHSYCMRRVGERHTAEELAQEAFVRALLAMPRFAGERRFYPWMTVIAQRLCIDHHRRNGRCEPTDDIDAGTVEPDHDFLYRQVDRDQVVAALERLAPRHREVLDLRERSGLSYAEIAAALEVPVSTVEALLHRARKSLRREYLAVAGRDRAWGIPLVGALAARTAPWRDRVPEAVAWAGPAAAAAAAVAVLALPSAGPEPAPAVESLEPAAVTATAPAVEPAAPVVVTTIGPPTTTGAPPAAPAPPPPPPADAEPPPAPELPPADVQAGPARLYTDPDKVDDVAEHTESMAVHGRLHDLFYGADPSAPPRNVADSLRELTTTALGGTP